MRRIILALVPALVLSAPVSAQTTSCHHAYLVEAKAPAALDSINTTEPSFTAYAWAWGANPSDQGSEQVGLVDDGTGIGGEERAFAIAAPSSTACAGRSVGPTRWRRWRRP